MGIGMGMTMPLLPAKI